MKRLLKTVLHGVSLAVVFIPALLSGFGRMEAVYLIFAQSLAQTPGILGDYLRIAYYRMTLDECALESRIQFGSFFAHPQVRLGRSVYIGSYCVLGRVSIGDRTQIASAVQILSGRRQHARDSQGRILGAEHGDFTPVSIGADCWIGAAAIVMADVGAGCTIGAGSVVVKPVPAGSVAVGSPARVVKTTRSRAGKRMLKFGIWTHEQYLREGERRRYYGARVSYALLDVGSEPSAEQVRAFEDIGFTLRTTNGTYRTTFRNRFRDVDAAAIHWMGKLFPADAAIRIQDRAASHGLTSWEWAEPLYRVFPNAELESSDLLQYFIRLSFDNGETYIVEPDGQPLQYIKPPFVVGVHHPEPRRYPVNQWVASRARRRFANLRLPEGWMKSSGGAGYTVARIPYLHPEALKFSKTNPGFRFRERSVFEHTPGVCDVLRTMNILNKAYFSDEQLAEGVRAVFDSLRPGGLWIVGRTLEEVFTNHATFLRRKENGWEVLGRIGDGSEMEQLALNLPVGSSV